MCENNYRKNSKIRCCKYCNMTFHSGRELQSHYKECAVKNSLPKDSLGRTLPNDNTIYICKFCSRVCTTKSSYITHVKRCILNPDRIPYKSHPLSEEAKKKMSEAAIRNLECGKHNHYVTSSIKLSYAEQYFFDCFTNSGLSFGNNVWVGKYCLDFVVGNNYFEVDGEQHYTEDGIIKDSLRTEYLKNLGMNLIGRCRWSVFKSLSDNDKHSYVQNVISKLHSGDYIDPLQYTNNIKQTRLSKRRNIYPNTITNLKHTIKELTKLKSLMIKLDLLQSGKIRSDGCIHSRMFSDSQWETFRDLILNSGVDLTKYGWVGKVENITKLSKKIIRNTVRHFNIQCFERSYNSCTSM